MAGGGQEAPTLSGDEGGDGRGSAGLSCRRQRGSGAGRRMMIRGTEAGFPA
jgi:hypothetical protein